MEKENTDSGRLNKERIISVRVTETEFAKIHGYATQFNLGTGTYLRLSGLLGHLPYAVQLTPTVPGAKKISEVTEISAQSAPAAERRLRQAPKPRLSYSQGRE